VKKLCVVVLLLLAAMPSFAAKKEHLIEFGIVVDQNLQSAPGGAMAMPVGTAVVAVPLYRQSNVVTIDTAFYRYQWLEVGLDKIILPVNDVVEFYRDHDRFIVMDSRHRKHRFELIGMRELVHPPDSRIREMQMASK